MNVQTEWLHDLWQSRDEDEHLLPPLPPLPHFPTPAEELPGPVESDFDFRFTESETAAASVSGSGRNHRPSLRLSMSLGGANSPMHLFASSARTLSTVDQDVDEDAGGDFLTPLPGDRELDRGLPGGGRQGSGKGLVARHVRGCSEVVGRSWYFVNE